MTGLRRLDHRPPAAWPIAASLLVVGLLLLLPGSAVGPAAWAPGVRPPATGARPVPAAAIPASDPASWNGRIINGASVITNIGVKDTPTTASWDSGHGYLYVTNYGSPALGGNTVSVLNQTSRSVVATLPVGDDPLTSAYDPSDGYDYVLNFGTTHNLSIFDGTTLKGIVTVGTNPATALYDPGDGEMYVCNIASNNVSVVSGTSLVASVPVGNTPGFSAYDPTNQYVYVPNTGSDNVTVLHGTSTVANISVGGSPYSAVYDPWNGWVYVLNSLTNNATIINGTTVQANIPAGGTPVMGGYDPLNHFVYITDTGTNTINVVNGTTVVANLSVGIDPRNVVFDAASGNIVIPDWSSNDVTLINGTSIVATVGVGPEPYAATYDPATQQVYVVDFNNANVTVLGSATSSSNLTFHESGLPSGTRWSVTLGSTTYISSAGNVSALVPNGSYNYSLASLVPQFTPAAPSGSVNVAGTTVVNVTFDAAYAIKFQESGLGAGIYWNVSIGSRWNDTGNATSVLWEPNGSYTYHIAPIAGYTATWSGPVGVNGANATVVVTFRELLYSVDFTETGLAGGTAWTAFVGSFQNNSTAATLNVRVPNGSYIYTLPPVNGYLLSSSSGPVTVSGNSPHVGVTFTPIYRVSFHETGLPFGGNWSVHIGSTNRSSITPYVNYTLKNGSYSYTIATLVGGYSANSTAGVAHVNGGAVSVPVSFSSPSNASTKYAVQFKETGLLSGAIWTVSLDGISRSTGAASQSILLPNGTYPFLANATDYSVSPSTGSIVVNGPASVATPTLLTFAPLTAPNGSYSITFRAVGLSSGVRWGLSLGGFVLTSTNSTIVFHESNGTLAVRVEPLPGYQVLGPVVNETTWTGTVTVSGASETFTIGFETFFYQVRFQETGLPGGDSWSVSLNLSGAGQNVVNETIGKNPNISTHPLLLLWAPNGTFPYTVPSVAGFSSPAGGSVTVSGSDPPQVNLTFHGGAAGGPAFPVTEIVVIVGAGVLISLVAAVFLTRRSPAPGRSAPVDPEDRRSGAAPGTEDRFDAATGVRPPSR